MDYKNGGLKNVDIRMKITNLQETMITIFMYGKCTKIPYFQNLL